MTALVTGASGFVGRYLVRELLSRGQEVIAVVRPSRELPSFATDERVEVVRADLRRPPEDLTQALRDVDRVFHLAAAVTGGWRGMFDSTVHATENLLGAMSGAEWRGRLVHVSTFSVYGYNQIPAGATIDEASPLEPEPHRRGDYAWTKVLQERLVRERAAESGWELAVVRPGAIYGAEHPFQARAGRRLGARAILLFGGRTLMPLNYVENTASLLAECGEHPRAAGEVFNAVDPDPPRQLDYLRAWRRSQPGRIGVISVPLAVVGGVQAGYAAASDLTSNWISAPGVFDRYVMAPITKPFRYATSKPTAVLGWTPPVTREEAFRRTFGNAGASG